VIKLLEVYKQKLENAQANYEARIGELKDLISGLSFQQGLILQKPLTTHDVMFYIAF
jgi:hypothetical protein